MITRRRLLKGAIAGISTLPVITPKLMAQDNEEESAWIYNPAGITPSGVFVDELLLKETTGRENGKPPLLGDFPRMNVECIYAREMYATVNRLFYQRGWGDGLPIVPPAEDLVKAMLKCTDMGPEEVVGLIEPMKGQATVTKIAVNAVMAGCRPEYLPVVIAAVKVIADPDFSLLGVSTTTNPDTPMIIVNGPIVRQLEINAGTNALGRGREANATIGRALHLVAQNIGGSKPGITDLSCLGQPGEFAMCLAENEEKNPWGTLHTELGYPKDANVVTVVAAEGIHSILGIGWNDEGYLSLVSDHLAGLDRSVRPMVILIIAQDTAAMLAGKGWTKESIRKFVYEHARIPFSKYKKRFIETRKVNGVPSWVLENTDPAAMIPVPFMNHLLILVAGGTGEKSMLIPVWSGMKKPLSREIRLPSNWEDILKRAKQSTVQ
ncbi:MAG TPA: hypothetical protein PLA18_10280 [Deltaproteobacteria bacterium]|jgi:hypothetical protein|nr:hypothetical protein [Deltaproteobacteria bacterium]